MKENELILAGEAGAKPSRKKVLTLVLAVLAVGGMGFALWPRTDSAEVATQTVYKETQVSRGDITVGVTESATATISNKSVSVDFDTTVEEVYVKAGQSVKEGDPLAKVSTDDLQEQIKDLQTSYEKAKTSLESAIINQKLQTLNAEYEYKTNSNLSENAQGIYNSTMAQLEYDTASYANNIDSIEDDISYYKKLIKGYSDTADEVSQLKAVADAAKATWDELAAAEPKDGDAIAKAQIEYTTAYNNYKKAKDDYENELDNAETKLENLENEYDAAKLKYQSSLSKLDTDTLDAELTYEQSLVTAENAQTLYELELAQLNNAVTTAQIEVEEAAEELADMQETVATGVLTAPCDGLVVSVAYDDGDDVNSGQAIVTVTNSQKVYITTSIAQEDIASIRLDSPANVLFSAYEDKFIGTVDSIAIVPARSNSSTVSYTVTVKLEGDTSAIYEGMTGDVTFVTKEMTDVLYLSNKAITTTDGKSYVKVKDEEGNITQVEVTTGFSDGKNVEVLTGLEEGQTALIESQVRG